MYAHLSLSPGRHLRYFNGDDMTEQDRHKLQTLILSGSRGIGGKFSERDALILFDLEEDETEDSDEE